MSDEPRPRSKKRILLGVIVFASIPLLALFVGPSAYSLFFHVDKVVPPIPPGSCYTYEGFKIAGKATIVINETSVPIQINWDQDVRSAYGQFNGLRPLYTEQSSLLGNVNVFIGWKHLTKSGELGEADVSSSNNLVSANIWLDSSVTWTDQGAQGFYSVEHVLLHELGHVTGLGHIDTIGCENNVMWPSVTASQSLDVLGTGDIQGVVNLYK